MKIYIIDENINMMGGAERIVSVLSNELSKKYSINVISLFEDNNEPFFNYSKAVNRKYLFKRNLILKRNSLAFKIKLMARISRECKLIDKTDVVIFGRASVAAKFMPFINSKRIIVRDAIHYYNYSFFIRNLIKKYFKRKVTTFFVSSKESMDVYRKKIGLNNMKIIYNPLGIIPSYNNTKDSKKIIAVGRFEFQKGYDTLLLIFKRVVCKHPDWKLEIVGGNQDEYKLLDLVQKLNLEKNVYIIEKTSNIVEKYNEAAIYVMTSRYEGYANSLVEAMSCGLPCISFDWLLGVDNIICNNKNGIIVPLKDRFKSARGINYEEDIINFSNALNYLIENENIRNKIGSEAKCIAKSRNLDNIINIWCNEIEGMIKNG